MSKHYINGLWVIGEGTPFTSINPADGTTIWQGTNATEREITAACDAARKSLFKWEQCGVGGRANYILKFTKTVEARREELALLIAKEAGKPLWEAKTEVNAVIGKANLSIQAYHERFEEKEIPNPEAPAHLRYKPHGVVAILGPFNFPAHLNNGHIIPALLAGNTVVCKPSELTPAVGEFIFQCWHDSDLPAGVINGIQGGVNTAKTLLNQDLQGVYFTGSYTTGVRINKHFSERPDVILALEMGGNNPLIIDDVENLQAAIYHTLLSSFITAGQRCTCARRVFIPDNAHGDKFLQQFIKATKELGVGPYTEKPEPFFGPVISYEHALAHLTSQESLKQMGGHVLLEMKLLLEKTGLISPGIMDMTGVTNPPDEEIFAPFVQIYRYSSFEQALILANNTRYGLVAGLLSDNHKHYQQFYTTIRAGLINWNRPTTGAAGNLPFGGVGYSGNHRPSGYFAGDYCVYPIASLEQPNLLLPSQCLPGIPSL